MATDTEIRQVAELIREAIPKKNRYDQPIWQGVLNLIEQSEFGKKDASADVVSPLPPGRSEYDEMMDGGFDGVQIEMLKICNSILGGHGSVSVVPYSKGLGTRSMTFAFKAGKPSGVMTVQL